MKSVDKVVKEIRTELRDIRSQLKADVSAAGAMVSNQTVFKTHIQKGRRISIPKAEAEAMNLEEGDLVQVIVQKINKSSK